MDNFIEYIKEKLLKRQNLFCTLGLFMLSYFFFFYALGDYRLIDVDETRYINIARQMFHSGDYITPVLNFEPFLEKPPLLYWIVCLSYKIFNTTNEFASRFPIALFASFGVFATYFFVRNIVKSNLTAFLSAVILMSSFWFGLFARVGILDSTFSILCTIAFYSGISTLFVEREYKKKILWYLGYFFLGLSVLQKGLIGILLPGGALLIVFLVFKRAKEIIKPSYLIFGILIFLITAIPWHYLVYRANGELWVDEYIIKHHLARFINSYEIGRKQPFLFYAPIVLGGFMPWSAFLIFGLIKLIKKIKLNGIRNLFLIDNNKNQLITICLIWFLFTFIFFSISSTKLPTYILPLFPPVSILMGLMFNDFIKNDISKKGMVISSYITFAAFFLAGLAAIAALRLNVIGEEFLPLALCFLIFPYFGFFAIKKYDKNAIFNIIMSFSLLVVGLNSHHLFNFATGFNQTELEDMVKIVNNDKTSRLITYKSSRKYSLLNNYKKEIAFFTDEYTVIDYEIFKLLKQADKKRETIYMIVKNKRLDECVWAKFFKLVYEGQKFSLYKRNPS